MNKSCPETKESKYENCLFSLPLTYRQSIRNIDNLLEKIKSSPVHLFEISDFVLL